MRNVNQSKASHSFQSVQGGLTFNGVADRTIHWVTQHQLLDAPLWAKFVNQFRLHSDTANNGWRGEYWGKMMRGSAMVYQYTQDVELFRVLTQTVEELLTTQMPDGGFSSYRPGTGFCHWDVWCRKYVLLGLEYYLEICTDQSLCQRVLSAMCAHADAILERVGNREDGKIPITETSGIYGGMNSASILEPMVRLYRLTGEERYLRFATHILSTGGSRDVNIFRLAYEDRIAPFAYGVNKAYEMMSCFEGLIEYYEATGDVFCREAAVRFARRVMDTEVTVIGCCGTLSELFDHSAVRQTERPEGVVQETCVSVTWMKLCRRLFAVTGDTAFLDAVEQTYYNAYLSTLNTEGCYARNRHLLFLKDSLRTLLPFDSYSPLIPDVRGKETGGAQVLEDNTYYGCCAAIASAGAAVFPQSALWRDPKDGIFLGLYEDGEAGLTLPSGQALRMRIRTAYPAELCVRVTFEQAEPERFCFGIRVPGWSEKSTLICGGERLAVTPGIQRLEREWRNGDVLELTLDPRAFVLFAPIYGEETIYRMNWNDGKVYPCHVTQSDEARRYVSLRRGALTLAADRRLGRNPEAAVHVNRADRTLSAQPVPPAAVPYPCMAAFRVQLPQESLLLTDYASAGRLWSRESEAAAWLPARYDQGTDWKEAEG